MITFISIKHRLIFTISLFIALLLVVIASGTYAYFLHTTRELIFSQQYSRVTAKASDMDRQITAVRDVLTNVANVAQDESVSNHTAIQQWLNDRTGIRTCFTHSLIVLDRNGILVASIPAMSEKYGTSYAMREFFTKTAGGRQHASTPFLTMENDRPVMIFTAPIRSKDGSLKGMLCGSIDLLDKENIFGTLLDRYLGSNGYMYLFAPDRTMIMHPDSSRILKKDIPPGANRLLDKALAGFEGSGETINSNGLHFLASFKRLRSTGWILGANYPTDEAYQPITTFRNYYLLGMFLVLLISVALAGKLGAGIVGPLTDFTLRIKELAQPDSDERQKFDGFAAYGNDELGLLAGSFNALLDEVKRREEALQESEEKFRTVADHTYDWEYWRGADGSLIYISPSCERITGYTAQEFLQDPELLSRIIHPDDLDEFICHLEVGEEGAVSTHCHSSDFRIHTRNGEECWINHVCQEVYDSAGKPIGRRASNRDITKRKEIEEKMLAFSTLMEEKNAELESALLAAEEGTKAKSTFLATISHELRTPMNGVIGMTAILLDSELNEEQREFAEIIRKSGENLLSLINNILDFSKIEAHKLEIEALDFDLRTTLEDTAELLAVKAVEAGLELICRIDPSVPFMLRGDPGRIRQVITNLAANAIKFTPVGEVVISAEVESHDPLVVRFSVSDTGIGIPESRLAAIFNPFTQVDDSTTRKYGGTGLGLAICKELAELMGGRIGVESRVGEGTTFWFTANFQKQPQGTEKVFEPDTAISGARILVVDHSATNRMLIITLLDSWGCRYETAGDGETALALAHEALEQGDPFRIALLDQQIVGMDGVKLGLKIKAEPRLQSMSLILLSAMGQRGAIANYKNTGFAAYLTKPLKQSQLYKCLTDLLVCRNAADVKSSAIAGQPVAEAIPKNLRILLAEDNAINQKVAQSMLGKLGYQADIVTNGLEAVKALELIHYDLVLMDCLMPELDGFEATTVIRDNGSSVLNHDIPIIALTANAMKEDREKCLQSGMNDYLAKPLRQVELARVLAAWATECNSLNPEL